MTLNTFTVRSNNWPPPLDCGWISYYIVKVVQEFTMPFAYMPQKAKFRVTLELDVMDDFQPHNIDWEKILDIQGAENVNAYVEDLSTPDRW